MRDRPSGFFNPWFHLALNILCVLAYELLLKAGATATADLSKNWSWTGITGLASPLIWLAILFIILDLMIMVRHRIGYYRAGHRCQTGRSPGRTLMTLWSLVLILVWLVTFVAGQLFFKRAMELSSAAAFRNRKVIFILGAGLLSMTISFFLNLGLLQRFDLSYLYPFQGLSVIIISLMAAVILKEKLTMKLTIGSLLITVGVVLVSLS